MSSKIKPRQIAGNRKEKFQNNAITQMCFDEVSDTKIKDHRRLPKRKSINTINDRDW